MLTRKLSVSNTRRKKKVFSRIIRATIIIRI